MHVLSCASQLKIKFYRKEPDLPFGFWFLGQQKHVLHKRRLDILSHLIFPKLEEKDNLHFGIIKPVEAEGILKKVFKYFLSLSFKKAFQVTRGQRGPKKILSSFMEALWTCRKRRKPSNYPVSQIRLNKQWRYSNHFMILSSYLVLLWKCEINKRRGWIF